MNPADRKSLTFVEHGLHFTLCFDIDPSRELAELVVPNCWTPGASSEPVDFYFLLEHGDRDGVVAYRLWVNGELVMGASLFEQFAAPAAKKIHWYVAQASRREYFLHAGVVAIDGKVVLFPGRTFSGKSTLVNELVDQGMTYFSDEYALLCESEPIRVRAFPRQLSLRDDVRSRESSKPKQGKSSQDLQVDSIYFLDYDATAGWSIEPLTPGRAVLRLFENALVAQSRPVELMQALGQLCSLVPCFQGTRGGSRQAAQLLIQEVRSRRSVCSGATQPAAQSEQGLL